MYFKSKIFYTRLVKIVMMKIKILMLYMDWMKELDVE